MHLILIGLRGSGKSTAGRATADLVSRPFIDLDQRTEAICGLNAMACFEQRGENAWRKAEASALRNSIDEPDASIIALGGGTPTAPHAAAMLQEARRNRRVRIVWLQDTPANLASRIVDDQSRPPPIKYPIHGSVDFRFSQPCIPCPFPTVGALGEETKD